MSHDGSTLLKWPDEERKFRLGIGELIELQEKCDAGPAQIFRSVSDMTWRVQWVRETIRLGLIGGGLEPTRALALVGRYVTPGSLMVCAGIAQEILGAALIGDLKDPVGKAQAGEVSGDMLSPPSTEPAQSSDLRPQKSGNARSGNSLR